MPNIFYQIITKAPKTNFKAAEGNHNQESSHLYLQRCGVWGLAAKTYRSSTASSRRGSKKARYKTDEKMHLRYIASLLPSWTKEEREKIDRFGSAFGHRHRPGSRVYAMIEQAQYRGDSYRDFHNFLLVCVSDRYNLNGGLPQGISPCECCLEWRKAREEAHSNGLPTQLELFETRFRKVVEPLRNP